MAQQKFKTALTAAAIPFRYAQAPNGVLVPGSDVVNRTSGAFAGRQDNVDYNVIETSYAQNVLPTKRGYASVGFEEVVSPITLEAADPYWSTVQVLLDMEDAGSGHFIDRSQNNHPIATYPTTPTLNSTIKKFGNTSWERDNSNFPYIQVGGPTDDDWMARSLTSWTVEMFAYPTFPSFVLFSCGMYADRDSTFSGAAIGLTIEFGTLYGWWKNKNTGAGAVKQVSLGTVPAGMHFYAMHYDAVARQFWISIDSTVSSKITLDAESLYDTPASSTYLLIGRTRDAVGYYTGYIDEVRISSMVRYPDTIIVPVEAFPLTDTETFETDMDELELLRDDNGQQALYCHGHGKNYLYNQELEAWQSTSPFQPQRPRGLVTYAFLNGISYVFFERDRLQSFDLATLTVINHTLTLPAGVSISQIRGIFANGNYLCLFTEGEILWSTQTNIFEFSNFDQGAGRGIPNSLRGTIIKVLPIDGGAIIYTGENAVGMRPSNNALLPFIFAEIKAAYGVNKPESVTAASADGYHYTLGPGGIQRVSLSGAESLFPDAVDFLSGHAYDYFDYDANPMPYVAEVETSEPLRTRLTYAAGRYLIASFGNPTSYAYAGAIIFDLLLMRWGRVRISHMCVGILPVYNPATTYSSLLADAITWSDALADSTEYLDWIRQDIPTLAHRDGILFMSPNGSCQKLVVGGDSGVLMLGRVQLTRGSGVCFQELLLEGTNSADVVLLGSHSGVDREVSYIPTNIQNGDNYSNWAGRFPVANFDVLLMGSFDLTQASLVTTKHVRRQPSAAPPPV